MENLTHYHLLVIVAAFVALWLASAMKSLQLLRTTLALAGLTLWATGCATRNVNPAQARANTGYVDFCAPASDGLAWEIQRFDAAASDFQPVFSQFDPVADEIVGLAFAPGRHRFQVTFLNRVIVQPVEIEVVVEAARITPIRATLVAADTVLVETREVCRGGTSFGRYGRQIRIASDETTRYRITIESSAPIAYRPKEEMSYAR
jgi:hypothetical protein